MLAHKLNRLCAFYVIQDGDNLYRFYYDVDGVRTAMEYNGNMYYYQYNLQGDVTGIYDSNFNKVVYYLYDSWGKLLEYGGSMANTVGTANPFRYRGYYYDEESGFYYLNSRYYDPETGRFINADGYISTGVGILGTNMFSYCYNNPVIMSDSLGTRPISSTQVISEDPYERKISCMYMSKIAREKSTQQQSTVVPNIKIVIKPNKTLEEKKEFVNAIYEIAKSHEERTNIPAALLTAQACYESGYGTSNYAVKKNNLFGFIGYEYASPEDSIASYEKTLTGSIYKSLMGKDLKGWVYGIGPAGYCSDPDYGDNLWAIIEYWDLDKR